MAQFWPEVSGAHLLIYTSVRLPNASSEAVWKLVNFLKHFLPFLKGSVDQTVKISETKHKYAQNKTHIFIRSTFISEGSLYYSIYFCLYTSSSHLF